MPLRSRSRLPGAGFGAVGCATVCSGARLLMQTSLFRPFDTRLWMERNPRHSRRQAGDQDHDTELTVVASRIDYVSTASAVDVFP
jgi:hypothetical protein